MAVIAIILLFLQSALPLPRLVVDGREHPWPQEVPADSLRQLVGTFQRAGYYFAAVDSVRADEENTTVYVSRGPEVRLTAVYLHGATALDSLRLVRAMETRPGTVLDPAILASDLDLMLQQYEQAGFPLARIEVAGVRLLDGDPPGLALHLEVEEGEALELAAIRLDGARRTTGTFAARATGLRPGQPLRSYDPATIQRRLEATDLFRRVDLPALQLDAEGRAVIVVPVEEDAPGAFDLVLGYQPPAGGGRGSVVGNGHLLLQNLFGGGRVFSLRLNRLPGQVSRTNVRASDPFLFGWPLRVEARFEGYQRDSTYGRQDFQIETGFRFTENAEAFVRVSRSYTRPGVAGLQTGTAIPRADAWFGGLGLRYTNLDRALNPRRGLHLSTLYESGRKGRAVSGAAEAMTPQQRLEAEARLYVPLFRRQVLVGGLDVRVLLAEEYDESDLFRLGGFSTLRGYDEDRFSGNAVGRLLTEWRLLLDRESYLFAFADMGYVNRPHIGEIEALSEIRPGYGFGIQYRTTLGVVVISYAVNPEDGLTNGRVHAGLSVGL